MAILEQVFGIGYAIGICILKIPFAIDTITGRFGLRNNIIADSVLNARKVAAIIGSFFENLRMAGMVYLIFERAFLQSRTDPVSFSH